MRNHSITCRDADVGTFGVRLDGRGAAVRNGQIRGCDFGVDLVGTGKHVVRDLSLVECNDNSVQIRSDKNFVADNDVIGGDWAFAVLGAGNVVARNRSLRSNGDGFFVGGDGNRLYDNAAIFSVCGNFVVRGSGNELRRNVAAGTLLAVCDGFDVVGRENRLRRNAVTGSAASGVRVDGDANRISGNTSTDNAAAGIRLSTTAQENSVRGNDAFGNATFDLQDDNPACDRNGWFNNRYATSSASCIE
jgi:parallel beta-helix repeat protein